MTSPLSMTQRQGKRTPIQNPSPVATLLRADGQVEQHRRSDELCDDQSGNAVLGLAWATALSVPLWVGIALLFRLVLGGV